MQPKIALITGITGQDGAYLAQLLLDKGYIVHGVKRRSSSFNTARVDDLYVDPHEHDTRFFMHYGDMTDATNLIRLVQEHQPDEIYNLAAQSHVQVSFETPEYTANADALGTLRLLEAIRILGIKDKVRFYQASTSELYGKVQEVPQSETTPFYPRSPYGAAKLYAYWITVNYREAYGMHASNGILFNHEGPMRGETFVTRKITRAVAAIEKGLQERLYLGNLSAQARLGPRARFRRRHVADAAAARARRLRAGDRRNALGARVRRARVRLRRPSHHLARRGCGRGRRRREVRQGGRARRPELLPSYRGRAVAWRSCEGEGKLGWESKTTFDELVSEMVDSDLKAIEREAWRHDRTAR